MKPALFAKAPIVATSGLAMVVLAASLGRPTVGSADPFQAPSGAGKFVGSKVCESCHKTTPEATPFKDAVGFIQLNEFDTWRNKDKHSIAYSNLLGDRAKNMGRLLGLDVTKRESGCLACHSASPSEVIERQDAKIAFDRSEGVSCENCHGPAGGWIGPHIQVDWRTVDPAKKKTYGMTDMFSPARQAEKCLSCHIGDNSEKKVVTHAMYAAGHPPLPSIDVAKFSDDIPRHWWLTGEKKSEEVKKQFGYVPGELERTRLSIVSAAVALKTQMKLIADEAALDTSEVEPGKHWPDYARFDCYACHHELKRDSWRQERGYAGPPGRPPVNQWPSAIVLLGIHRLSLTDASAKGLEKELTDKTKAVLDASHAKPFGARQSLSKAAGELAAWADALAKRLDDPKNKIDAKTGAALLKQLASYGDEGALDWDTARHVGWVISIIHSELDSKRPEASKVAPIVAKLNKGLNLSLPAGRETKIEDYLRAALQTTSDYDPRAFSDDLRALAVALGSK